MYQTDGPWLLPYIFVSKRFSRKKKEENLSQISQSELDCWENSKQYMELQNPQSLKLYMEASFPTLVIAYPSTVRCHSGCHLRNIFFLLKMTCGGKVETFKRQKFKHRPRPTSPVHNNLSTDHGPPALYVIVSVILMYNSWEILN